MLIFLSGILYCIAAIDNAIYRYNNYCNIVASLLQARAEIITLNIILFRIHLHYAPTFIIHYSL